MQGAPKGGKSMKRLADVVLSELQLLQGQVDGEFIAPMIYTNSMTSDFFVEWFKMQLLPALKTPHVIIMDNASFDPKNILDELGIQDKPFYPSTAIFTRFESYWASLGYLEKKVTVY